MIFLIDPKVALDYFKKVSEGSISRICGLWSYRYIGVCVCEISQTPEDIPPTMRSGICVRGVRDEVGGGKVCEVGKYNRRAITPMWIG